VLPSRVACDHANCLYLAHADSAALDVGTVAMALTAKSRLPSWFISAIGIGLTRAGVPGEAEDLDPCGIRG